MLKLAFYKGGKTFFDRVTRWRTNGVHTHVELVFSDGVAFSSSQWDGGTRFKSIDFDPAKWDLVQVTLRRSVREANVRDWCSLQLGMKYDWRGILRFFAGRSGEEKRERWFCSEICGEALRRFGILPADLNPANMSPEDLFIAATAREGAILKRAA